MGLTNRSVGRAAAADTPVMRADPQERVIALAGNPNVGKSTLFNALTGLHQHTGNWPGKTVGYAQGVCTTEKGPCRLVDTPGTYSLLTHSAEEEIARDCICFSDIDGVTVVCDATCLERNLHLVLQTIETGQPVTVCVNLMDEARRKRIAVDLSLLEQQLGVPVVAAVARRKASLHALTAVWDKITDVPAAAPVSVTYPAPIEIAVSRLQPLIEQAIPQPLPGSRWLALRLLEADSSAMTAIRRERGPLPKELLDAVEQERQTLRDAGYSGAALTDALSAAIGRKAQDICREAVRYTAADRLSVDRRIDRAVTSRWGGYPLMVLLLALVLWITIVGANYPSQWLSQALFWGQEQLTLLCERFHVPDWIHGSLVLGVYRVLAWVVSVMLPPMAIFFPLFTLLEDVGYLPRIAYNLDRPFQRCHACGKQALTMCMGFGCNAAGVVGCRIIDSPRERMLAILTNNLVPCNGRFPTLITLISLFFIGSAGGGWDSMWAALLLTLLILLGIGATLLLTKLLAVTVLKGTPSAFTLELPPYRPPQVGQVLVRSLLDRTIFVLGRAVAVAAPAGLLIWVMGNVTVGGQTLLSTAAGWLDPIGGLLGMDGAILLAFILGFPANEIVLPLILMIYMAEGTLPNTDGMTNLLALLTENGWTWLTAASTMLFSLFHWPCSTTLLTIKKETGSWKWTGLAALLPTLLGVICCMLLTGIVRLCGG